MSDQRTELYNAIGQILKEVKAEFDSKLEASGASHRDELSALSSFLDSTVALVEELKGRIDTVDGVMHDQNNLLLKVLDDHAEKVNRVILDETSGLLTRVAQSGDRLKSTEIAVSELSSLSDRYETDLATLAVQVDDNHTSALSRVEVINKGLDSRLGELADSQTASVERLKWTDSAVSELVTLSDKHGADLSALVLQVDEKHSSALSLVGETKDVLVSRLTSLADSHAASTERVEEFQTLLSELTRGVETQVRDLVELSARVSANFSESQDQTAQIRDFQTQLGDLNTSVGVSDGRIDRSLQILSDVASQTESHTEVLETLVGRIEAEELGARLREGEIQTSMEGQRKLLDQMLDDFSVQLAEQGEAAESGIRTELTALLDAKITKADTESFDRISAYINTLAPTMKGEKGDTGTLERVYTWGEGANYQELALVMHRGGLFQAQVATSSVPNTDSPDWTLVSNGIQDVRETRVSEDDKSGLGIIFEDSLGTLRTFEIDYPVPSYKDTWGEDQEYNLHDSVVENGHRWIARNSNPQGRPSKSSDWGLFAMRGARGSRGIKGETGDAGHTPSPSDIEKILGNYETRIDELTDGIPVKWWQSKWQYQTSYARGDIVDFNQGLWVCLVGNDGQDPPDKINSREWTLMHRAKSPGASGFLHKANNLSDVSDVDVARGNLQALKTDPTGITGASALGNIVSISQANYDLIATPDPTTLYVIV